MKDNKPLLLLLLAAILVMSWIYHVYDRSKYMAETASKYDSAKLAASIKDSLARQYSNTIAQLESRLAVASDSTDALKKRLDAKLAEINALRSEILGIIGKKYVSKGDITIAREKVGILQSKVNELSEQNKLAGAEKGRMDSVVQRLSDNVDSLQQSVAKLTSENIDLTEKVNLTAVFVASNIKIDGVDVDGNSETRTASAKKVNKFVAKFEIQNHVKSFNNAELLAVLIQPNGEVLQSTVWDSGSFETKKDGWKAFTRKIKFDYERDESKELLFSLASEKTQKGIYFFQVWHNGVLIGRAETRLN